MLSGIVGEAVKGKVPRRQSILSNVAGEANMEEGEVVRPSTSRVAGSGKHPQKMRWFDHSHAKLLEEINSLLIIIDFLWSIVLIERGVATRCLVRA